MGIRSIPFFKGKKGWQMAGGGQDSGGGGISPADLVLPIAPNTEYVTRYTYNGKPVYGYLLEVNSASTWNDFGVTGVGNFWYIMGVYYDNIGGQTCCLKIPCDKSNNYNYVTLASPMSLRFRANDVSGKKINVLAYYTKTSD